MDEVVGAEASIRLKPPGRAWGRAEHDSRLGPHFPTNNRCSWTLCNNHVPCWCPSQHRQYNRTLIGLAEKPRMIVNSVLTSQRTNYHWSWILCQNHLRCLCLSRQGNKRPAFRVRVQRVDTSPFSRAQTPQRSRRILRDHSLYRFIVNSTFNHTSHVCP